MGGKPVSLPKVKQAMLQELKTKLRRLHIAEKLLPAYSFEFLAYGILA